MSHTVVFFHAHPDDEALFTGGTMARLASEGHRVVLVTATAGEAGLASSAITHSLGLKQVRQAELAQAANILGCSRVVMLGYPDSGSANSPESAKAFSLQSPRSVASRLAGVLEEERASVLTTYDALGGYGHPDHVQVHRAGRQAARLAGTPLVAEATIDRQALQRALRTVSWLVPQVAELRPKHYDSCYSATDTITHRVDVHRYLRQKRDAMRAHASQATADGAQRTLAWFLRLPKPLFRLVFGHEWFVVQGRRAGGRPVDDLLDGLR